MQNVKGIKHPYSMVPPVTCIVVIWVKPVLHMHVGSGQTVELSTGGLFLLRFTLLKGSFIVFVNHLEL